MSITGVPDYDDSTSNNLAEENLSSNINEANKLLQILNKCVQFGSVSQTVGKYTMTSGEMTAPEGSEIHILSNEMYNYDFTAMSALTISIATKRGVKYFYYATDEEKEKFDSFKERIRYYYTKSLKSRQKVVAWIRQAKSNTAMFDDLFFITKTNRTLREIIKVLLTQCGKENKIKDVELAIGNSYNLDKQLNTDEVKLKRWISGEIMNDESSIYKWINAMSLLIKPILQDDELKTNNYIRDFIRKIEYINNMALLSRWQLSPKDWTIALSDDDQEELINFFKWKDENDKENTCIITDEIEFWLKSDEEIVGASGGEFIEQDVDSYLNNIVFCEVENNKPYELAYNFCIFIGYEPKRRTPNTAAAWYTTYSANNSKDCEIIDNDLFMVDIGAHQQVFDDLKGVFIGLILNNDQTMKTLKKNKSKMIKFLGIKDQDEISN